MEALKKAIDICGGVVSLAEKLGVTQPAVSNWLIRESVPPVHVIAIESATSGKVTRHELRPDIYPKEQAA